MYTKYILSVKASLTEERRAELFFWGYLEQSPAYDAFALAASPTTKPTMETHNMSEETMENAAGLVAEWLADLHARYIDEPTVSDVRIGVFYTAVEISTGDVGVAFTPRDLSDTVCCPKTAAGAPPAGRLIGLSAWEMSRYALAPSAHRRAVGVATLNALSAASTIRARTAGLKMWLWFLRTIVLGSFAVFTIENMLRRTVGQKKSA